MVRDPRKRASKLVNLFIFVAIVFSVIISYYQPIIHYPRRIIIITYYPAYLK